MANNGHDPLPDYPAPADPDDSGLLYNAMLQQYQQGAPMPQWQPKHYSTADLMALGQGAGNPTDGMSTYQRVTAGMGQGLSDFDLSAAQFFASNPMIAHALGQSAYANPELKKYLDYAARLKAQTDAPLLATDSGKVGSVAGQAAALALVK